MSMGGSQPSAPALGPPEAPLLALVLALLGAPAHAADLEISGSGLVRVRVDEQPARRRPGEARTWVVGLADGTHRVEVRDLLGRPRASLEVTVQGEERVILAYRSGALEEVARGRSLAVERAARELGRAAAMAATSAAVAAEAEAQAAAAHARAAQAQADAAKAATAAAEVQALLLSPGMREPTIGAVLGARTLPPGADPTPSGLSGGTGGIAQASVSVAGLDPALFSVTLGGAPVAYAPHLGAFVATDLSPGTTPLVVSLEGQIALSADFTTEGGLHVACTVLARPDGYDHGCVSGGAPLTAADLLEGRPVDPATTVVSPPGMEEGLFTVLVASVEGAPYARDKVGVLSSAAERHLFTCAQVVRLLAVIPYNEDKVEGVEALRAAIIDPQNAFLIEEALPFAEHKQAVRALFAAPAAAAPGPAPVPAP